MREATTTIRHPAEGQGLARGEAAVYKCRFAADRTPAFAGVAVESLHA
jgi:hypothetical protein